MNVLPRLPNQNESSSNTFNIPAALSASLNDDAVCHNDNNESPVHDECKYCLL